MAWAAGLALLPRNLLALGAYGAALTAISPAIGERRWLLWPLLLSIAAVGTVVYARYGLVVLTARCETCGERSYVGALWCRRTATLRPTLAWPLLQAALAIGLFLLIGAVAGSVRTLALWIAVEGGSLWTYLLTGDPLFRTTFLAAALVASIPIPLLVGNAVRLSIRESRTSGSVAE